MPRVQDFIKFVDASPSPFHATKSITNLLHIHNFQHLSESDAWITSSSPTSSPNAVKLVKGGRYYVTRNGSAVIAVTVGGKVTRASGFTVIGAHTDSPCLKVKPRSRREKAGTIQVGVEPYGGGLWHTWFDRDLSVAGRVLVRSEPNKLEYRLVRVPRPILRIPTLAIHLDRSEDFKFNKEQQLTPILAQLASQTFNKAEDDGSVGKYHHPLLLNLIAKELQVDVTQISDFELCLYDTQGASIGGANNEYVYSPRLDNLMMSFCSITALIESLPSLENDDKIRVVGLFDNEEVGSETAHGANSNWMEVTLRRLSMIRFNNEQEDEEGVFERAITRSILVSADMAHAVHPNYVDKHEEQHRPEMNKGVVIKENANQRYATTSVSRMIFGEVAKRVGVPLQEFVVKNDSPCGSTIGPMLSARLGIRTVDVGNAQWSMHSIRETSGVKDVDYAVETLKGMFEKFSEVDREIVALDCQI